MFIRTLALVMFCLFIGTSHAYAHAKMSKSSPAQGASVKAGLSEIQIGFSKPVRVMLVKVKNTDGKADVRAEFKPSKVFKTKFPFTVTPLAVGAHVVNWTSIAKDGHVMEGELLFKVVE